MNVPYITAEYSRLLRCVLPSYSGETCLEIGAGNGGGLMELSRNFRMVVGTDIVRPTMDDWTASGVSYVMADLAACFQSRSFDLVVFNPPYIGTETVQDVATDGGEEMAVPFSFLAEAIRVVKAEGRIVMLLNGEIPFSRLQFVCKIRGFGIRKLAEERLFYEELTVYEVAHETMGGRAQSDGELQASPGTS